MRDELARHAPAESLLLGLQEALDALYAGRFRGPALDEEVSSALRASRLSRIVVALGRDLVVDLVCAPHGVVHRVPVTRDLPQGTGRGQGGFLESRVHSLDFRQALLKATQLLPELAQLLRDNLVVIHLSTNDPAAVNSRRADCRRGLARPEGKGPDNPLGRRDPAAEGVTRGRDSAGWPRMSNPVRLGSYVSRAIARREIAGCRPGFWQRGQSDHPTPFYVPGPSFSARREPIGGNGDEGFRSVPTGLRRASAPQGEGQLAARCDRWLDC